MSRVQITKQTGRVLRVKPGVTPVVELDLEPHQRVVSFELDEIWPSAGGMDRKTTDWKWVAYIESWPELGGSG